jgi:thiol-disulfide isomerase/thioredoxin
MNATAVFLACLVGTVLRLWAAEPPPVLAIGARMPEFDLPGSDGKQHTPAEFAAAKVLVVMFTCNHCPEARAAAPRMALLDERYRPRGASFLAINGNHPEALRPDELGYSPFGDSFDEMKPFAAEYGWKFPYLYDGETQAVTTAFGAQATPHVFVFDAERTLRYTGRMDDAGRTPGPVEKSLLVDAIDALLAGREVAVKTTRPVGCSTKWLWKRASVATEQKEWEGKETKLDLLDPAAAAALRKNATDKLRVVNLWSTTCGPCVAEFPALIDTARRFQNRPVEMVTISLDPPGDREKVAKFLATRHAAVPDRIQATLAKEGRSSNNYLFDGNPDQLAEAIDPQWSGALPCTLLIAPGGEIVWRCNDEIVPLTLRREIVKWLDAKRAP